MGSCCDLTATVANSDIFLGTAVTFIGRLMVGSTALVQADVSTIKLYAYDLDSSQPTESLFDPITITVSTSIYDTLQTDDPDWPDSTGYNFKYTIADDKLVLATSYQVEIIIDTSTYGEVPLVYQLESISRITPQGGGPLLALNDQALLLLD